MSDKAVKPGCVGATTSSHGETLQAVSVVQHVLPL